jgi:hypothetical protein
MGYLGLQINIHWSSNSTPEMTTEKLQNLASASISAEEKVKILKLWNSSRAWRSAQMFPTGPFSDATFSSFLHKYVFWAQIRKYALEEILPMTDPGYLTGTQPDIFFPRYIENNRIRQWDYAFVEWIEAKEISKGNEWTKQPHGPPAARRLIYRFAFSWHAILYCTLLMFIDRV